MEEMAIMTPAGPWVPGAKLPSAFEKARQTALGKGTGEAQADVLYPKTPEGLKPTPADALIEQMMYGEQWLALPEPAKANIRASGEYLKKKQQIKRSLENLTEAEKDIMANKARLPFLKETLANEGPNAVNNLGWKMTDEGEIFIDKHGAPVQLPPFYEGMGKRGGPTALRELAQNRDDAFELLELLKDEDVARELGRVVKSSTLWGQIGNVARNKLRTWLIKKGIAAGSPKTLDAIIKLSYMASKTRHELLGAAVTTSEMRSVRAWLLSPGDSYELMMRKLAHLAHESDEDFINFVKLYEPSNDMSMAYRAWGLERFPSVRPPIPSGVPSGVPPHYKSSRTAGGKKVWHDPSDPDNKSKWLVED
jgi:hypothetical protein